MNKTPVFISILLTISICLYSQSSPDRFGKNIHDHLNSLSCPIDSNAGAYVVFDFATVTYDYSEHSGFSWSMSRHIRLKILNKNELHQAEFSVPLYSSGSINESVTNLKGVSYNLKEGKVIENGITRRDGILEKQSDYLNYFKFAVPNVEEGTLVEVSYTIQSSFPQYLRNWFFQTDIPVLHSEIIVKIPEYYFYHQNQKGYVPLTISKSTTESASLVVKSSSGGSFYTPSKTSLNTIQYNVNVKHFVAHNLPAMKAEGYVDNINNYRTGIEFELSQTRFGTDVTEYSTSWDAVANRLLKSSYFGDKMTNMGFAKDTLKMLTGAYPDQKELMIAIYSYVQRKIKWNNSTGFTNETIRQVYSKESGSSPDINFILLNMLKEAGFNAMPVALSTRQNGIILPTFPTRDGFNNMVVLVKLNDENVFLDASSRYAPPGVLPFRCLNGKGRVIHESYNSWIPLDPTEKYIKSMTFDMYVDESGDFNGNLKISHNGYASMAMREEIDEALSMEKLMEEMEEDHIGLQILSNEWKGLDDPYLPLDGQFEIEMSGHSDFMGDMISFNPLLMDRIENNPFLLEERKYPVNFGYARILRYLYRYTLPEGYEIVTLPSPINITAADKSYRFIYNVAPVGKSFSLTMILELNKPMFLPDEYAFLKEFYNHVVAKEAELVVIKKVTTP